MLETLLGSWHYK